MQRIVSRCCPLLISSVLLLAGCGNVNKYFIDYEELSSESAAETVNENEVNDTEPASASIFAMDTYMTVTAYSGDKQKAVDECIAKIVELDSLWNVNDENSDIARINSSSEGVETDPQTAELLTFALKMGESTGGALDVTLYPVLREWGFTTGDYHVPDDKTIEELLTFMGRDKVKVDGNTVTTPEDMMVDLGSVGKGKTGDCIAEIMRSNGVDSAMIDLGGNIQTVGRKLDGEKWKIGLKHPTQEGYFGVLETEDCAVVTSGGYERYFEEDGEVYWHILDPKTGRPANNGIISATAVAGSGELCDALSTSLFVMGEERAKEYWRTHEGFEMVLVTEDSRVIVTEGLENDFSTPEQTEILHR